MTPSDRRIRWQARSFKQIIRQAPGIIYKGPFVPQKMYKPPTNSDRVRYVEDAELEQPIIFKSTDSEDWGIPLSDALHSRVKCLANRDETVFHARGPSISIRLEVHTFPV
jgi:hypothetical protein